MLLFFVFYFVMMNAKPSPVNILDSIPPHLDTLIIESQNKLALLFDEPVEINSIQDIRHYTVNNNINLPTYAVRDANNSSLVHLLFPENFPIRTHLSIKIKEVLDLSGNALDEIEQPFVLYSPMPFDIIINEIMADPSPAVGLPEVEWIEIKNISSFDINIAGWRVAKTAGKSGPLPNYMLPPDSFLILCSTGSMATLLPFAKTKSVTSFPSLTNTGELIYLLSPNDHVIHTVNYSENWYQNELKKLGGWSLEMIDSHNPCSGQVNWNASIDEKGGSPGKENSIQQINPDNHSPSLLRAFAKDSITVVAYFDEPLDSTNAATPQRYVLSDGIGQPSFVELIPPSFDKALLHLNSPLTNNKIYTLLINNVSDCVNNNIGNNNVVRVGMEQPAEILDLVVNELLFNPSPVCNDYVELYNRSKRIINLKKIFVANENTEGIIDNITRLIDEDYLLFPGDYIVLTENASLVKNNYAVLNPSSILEVSLPSFNDDEGNVILLNEDGSQIDKLSYNEDWHFSLLNNKEGVSLERIDYNAETQNKENWHSASGGAGYGTPTYKNTQYTGESNSSDELLVQPKVFSPDNDGTDDFVSIYYTFSGPGYVVNMVVYDAAGRAVRNLQKNTLCGMKGIFRWDGLGENFQKLQEGLYILYTEVFNLEGKIKHFKNVIVLGKKK